MEATKSEPRIKFSDYPQKITCFKCHHYTMTKGDTYIGESSNIWPIGQIYYCEFCGESVGVTQDGRVTYYTGKIIGRFSAEEKQLIWDSGFKVRQIWELTKAEVDEFLAEAPAWTPETERFISDLHTYDFIIQERGKETAENWRRWQGQLHGAYEGLLEGRSAKC